MVNITNVLGRALDRASIDRYGALRQRYLDLKHPNLQFAQGSYLWLKNGKRILDAAGGPSVSCLGARDPRVNKAVDEVVNRGLDYVHSATFKTDVVEDLKEELRRGTGNLMSVVYLPNSGSEGVEAAAKLGRQYYWLLDQPERQFFIGRTQSYHGASLGCLALGSHLSRREIFEPMLPDICGRVSACNEYRNMQENESREEYVNRLAEELRAAFEKIGGHRVIGFVVEPVVGAALGCVPAAAGYLKAMGDVCREFGALLIFDEVMCGMGRTGTLHAWQKHGVVPDIQIIGKGLGGGYASLSGVLARDEIYDVIKESGGFAHGQTFQDQPKACAAALAGQKVIQEDNLLENVERMGFRLQQKLKHRLANHPNVGDIRGEGLFWAIEFVTDKFTKEPFPPELDVAKTIFLKALHEQDMYIYHGTGSAKDGRAGDHIILSPAFNITEGQIDDIVEKTARTIESYFTELATIESDPMQLAGGIRARL